MGVFGCGFHFPAGFQGKQMNKRKQMTGRKKKIIRSMDDSASVYPINECPFDVFSETPNGRRE